ncbi:MAG: hypothetical protein C0613_14315 [Desulfobulbaceae bacterium]|nr:MAG: hypothetical protein C0613_14315 [Desulfobulbaceae bacterium]
MQKSLLVTLRDITSCSQGVRFVSSFFHNRQYVELTLFYLVGRVAAEQQVSELWDNARGDNIALPSGAAKALALCRSNLIKKGFAEKQIKQVTRRMQAGTIQDIIHEAQNSLYDAVILGKRSTSFVEDIICGNKGHELLEKELASPVWFCRDPEEGRKDVLVCLDGSEVGEKVADHVGYILQGEEQHGVTLFHADKGQGVDKQKMFARVGEIFASYGIGAGRIRQVVVKPLLGVASAILAESDKGRYAAIAMGSIGRSADKGMYEKIVGSKCKNVFNEIDKAALWLVP